MTGDSPEIVISQNDSVTLRINHNTEPFLHISRSRHQPSRHIISSHTVYPIPRTKTNKYRSFIHYALAKYPII